MSKTTRAAARAAELAKSATRYANDRKAFRQRPDERVERVLKLIARIRKLSDTAAGDAKQEALREAWSAYEKMQGLTKGQVADAGMAAKVSFVGDQSDAIAWAEIDGYQQSRIDNGMRVADQAYEGWYGDYADFN